MSAAELNITLVSVLIMALLMAVYSIRVAVKGRVRFDRLDREGGSRLLSKSVMQAGYWFLHPAGKLLARLGVSPNAISWGSLGFGCVAGACLATGHFGFGAIFGTISALLDSLDGMVARLSRPMSRAGAVLDAAIDRYVEFLFLAGLIIYYRQIPALQMVALLALLGSFMVSYSSAKAEALEIVLPRGSMRRAERALYLNVGAALSTVSVFWFESDRFFSMFLGYPMVLALGLVAVVGNLSAVMRLRSISKALRAREKEATDARVSRAEPRAREEQQSQRRRRPAGIRL
jgi:phosphatidylglycerophosphate synthase